jgi:hypothetical protein
MKLNNRNFNIIFVITIRIIFIVLIFKTYNNYITYRKIIDNSKIIKYEVIKTEIHSGGRATSYSLTINYLSNKYSLNITSRVYKNIQNKIYPDLYYVESKDKVISNWQMKLSKRLFILFIICLVISFIPSLKLNKYMGKFQNHRGL